ncbi:MAG: preprotein translocase subunit SecA [Clostridium sp.]|nr:preprotein translocase subunit SecA [Clostridium sp.]MCM1399143.1 preprotein translocase subunit SecA [Clostridium sp.]
MGLFEKVFGTHSEKELKRINPIVDKIEALDETMQAMTDTQLKAKTEEFKKRLEEGETLDDLLVEAFAVVREAAARVLGMKHYRVQLIGGILLHQGRIPEMRTGEGKTLVSTLPAYLNALEGKGVHIVTVNDYLAKRDAEWMGKVHEFLGLTVGVILNSDKNDERRAAYNCDITYVTNNELGFDYLRDNMVIYKEQLVQRDLHYAIVDEVDSVLIDEARTPLIISGQSGKSTDLYKMCDYLARRMQRGTASTEISKIDAIMGTEVEEDGDYLVNEKDKQVVLTAQGVKEVEQFFHIENFSDAENIDIQHNMIMALRAHALMFRDKDYVVKDDEVLIVDEFTGRIMPGRRFSDGLHQAIEAKENVKVKRESRTLATITFQNFFNKYKKKAGMTGTALTEEQEFREIYGMDVVEVPTNLPIKRIDHNDSVFKTKKEKLNAIVQAVEESHAKGQPVLVGTINIDSSEELSRLLSKRGIQHKVLNAKFHEMEAEIVADAGQRGAVTIATNMAGRGTDIKLGEGVTELGGLKIIGTERHESRRIDNQLRGRSGRQGDPGESKFYLSLDDELMKLFGSEKVKAVYDALNIPEGEEIQHGTITKFVEKAQKKIESNNFAIRKNLLEFDQVNNDQREVIYAERKRVLNGESMRDVIFKMIQDTVESYVDKTCSADLSPEEWEIDELSRLLIPIVPLKPIKLTDKEKKSGNLKEFKQRLKEEAAKIYESKEAEFPEPEHIREVERVILLKVIDKKWMAHIDDMTQLRQGIGLQSYGSKDPVVEYKFAGFDMFNEMTAAIREETVQMILHVRIEQKVEREEVAKVTGTNRDDTAKKGPKRRESAKIGRNDPCPCGSGKKYKMCCGRNL